MKPLLALAALLAYPPAPPAEEVTRRLGPFDLAGRRFTAVLQLKRLAGEETLTALEFRDQSGKIHSRQTFPALIGGPRFQDTLDATVELLRGGKGTGLLVTYGVLPSTPLGGQSWQVFGLVSGKLAPFSKPLRTEGQFVKSSPHPALQAELLDFRVWTGNFFVIVPLRVDWIAATVTPAYRCWKMTSRGPVPRCQLSVEADRVPSDELTFVRLLPDTDDQQGIAEHAVVKKDSRVEFLAAEAVLLFEEQPDSVAFGVTGDVWLKVRIDGKEGWIHTEEDFRAIGLPQAG